jgi:hypothetical protein
MFNAQSIDHIYTSGKIVIYSFSLQSKSFLLKHQEHFTTILSHIQLDMKAKMTSNQTTPTIEYPKVDLICFIYDRICSMCRSFDNEKMILLNENLLKRYDVCFILVILS